MLSRRYATEQTVAITNDIATTGAISIGEFASGQIYVPAGSSLTGLTYHASPSSSGTYLPAQDASGSAVTQTVAHTKCYPIPAILFGAGMLKIVGNAAGNVIVGLKS